MDSSDYLLQFRSSWKPQGVSAAQLFPIWPELDRDSVNWRRMYTSVLEIYHPLQTIL